MEFRAAKGKDVYGKRRIISNECYYMDGRKLTEGRTEKGRERQGKKGNDRETTGENEKKVS